MLEGLFNKVNENSENSGGSQVKHTSSLQIEIAEQQSDRIKELVDENEQLRQRLSVYRNSEHNHAQSIELIQMLKNSHTKIENTNEDLASELDKMKKEKEHMTREWEKQVVELTYAVDSLKKRIYGDKIGAVTDRKSNKSRDINGSGSGQKERDGGKMYIEN